MFAAHHPGVAVTPLRHDWRADLKGRSPIERRALGVHRLVALQGVLVVALVPVLGFTYRGDDINEALVALVAAIMLAAILRWRGLSRIAALLEAGSLLMLGAMATACLTVLLATIAPPYRDSLLAGADRMLFPFLDWPTLARALAARPRLTAAMCQIYQSFLWQPFALVVLLALSGRETRLWRFLLAWSLALVASIAIFAIAPATAAYVHYGFRPDDLPFMSVETGWRPTAIIDDVRTGRLRELGLANMSGLITFPSFHTAGAVMLAWGFRRIPVVGPCFVALNALMILTVPLIGSHYFVDMVGGALVAMLAIHVSRQRITD